MDERKRFIEDWLAGGGENIAALCRVYAISRKTGYKWLERFRQGGLAALADRSHAAHRQSRRMAAELERRLIAARRRHPSWGPKKLRAWLERREPETPWPAASTIGEALKRAGLVAGRQRRRRLCAAPSPLREPAQANELWTIDPHTVVDAHSRYLLGCTAHIGTSYQEARSSLERLFQQRGLPRRMRSDNGTPFASTGAGRLSRLNVWWLKLGIVAERIEPGKPQQNGRHERMHRTLKAETARPPAEDRQRQQRRFDRFRQEYNQDRPHEALGQQPPAAAYETAQRPYPKQVPEPEYPGHWECRRVRRDGSVKFQGREYFLSEALRGETTGWVEVDEDIWQIWFGSAEVALYDAVGRTLWPLGSAVSGPRGGR
jgi:transposase InsO family protein